jgi:pyrroline-5-carboxylate reductase
MTSATPILLLGAGRMGGALIEGWLKAGAFKASDLLIRDPFARESAEAALKAGATLANGDADLSGASTVLLAVKPQIWKDVAAEVSERLAPDAVIVSIAAGVNSGDISRAFGGRRVARVMPTTAVSIRKGVASVACHDDEALARAHALFDPVATTVDLPDEAMIHAATGISGSAPAYFYAFVEALEAAGIDVGLPPRASRSLARATMAGAAALMEATGSDPADLRRDVTSPQGTTAAALEVLMGEEHGLGQLLREAVKACVRRSEELGG